jgi:predicted nucleotidyltransferase
MRLLYLFGSHATNQATAHSDIDLAVLLSEELSTVTRWELQQALALELTIDVDLIDLLSASTVMQNQIINSGVCLLDESSHKAIFEMQVMSMYQHLNEERASVLKAFKGS